jgi:hypothetical protein
MSLGNQDVFLQQALQRDSSGKQRKPKLSKIARNICGD